MKTTVELSDDVVEQCKRVARREGTTLRALIDEGLRLALKAREQRKPQPFRVQTFEGDGLSADYEGAGWTRLRDEIYRDRG